MPGNPFKKPFKGGKTRARPGRPSTPRVNVIKVPRATSPTGIKGRNVAQQRLPRVKVQTKARRSVRMPSVRQGAQMGTPGKTGSRPGAPFE